MIRTNALSFKFNRICIHLNRALSSPQVTARFSAASLVSLANLQVSSPRQHSAPSLANSHVSPVIKGLLVLMIQNTWDLSPVFLLQFDSQIQALWESYVIGRFHSYSGSGVILRNFWHTSLNTELRNIRRFKRLLIKLCLKFKMSDGYRVGELSRCLSFTSCGLAQYPISTSQLKFKLTIVTEVSANNRAGCQDALCKKEKKKILKGEIRFGVFVSGSANGHEFSGFKWRHWCVWPFLWVLFEFNRYIRQGSKLC